MEITKYIHSCLLIRTPDRVGIIDPGGFSWDSGLLDIAKLEQLDDIIITHEHADHLSVPFVQAIVAKFPNARITTTKSAAAQLKAAGIPSARSTPSDGIELFAVNHEPLTPLSQTPENIGVHYLGRITHPGDSQHFTVTNEVLALPVTAPWGTLVRAAQLGSELKPRYIIPIHDWHWNDTARAQAYDRLEAFFKERGIIFIKAQDGVAVRI